MKKLNKFFNIIELYIPMALFAGLFVFYVIIIGYRYIFHKQIAWIYELSVFFFLWCIIFAISYGSRMGTHVAFTIIYDRMSDKVKLSSRLIVNILIVVVFVILVPNVYNSLVFMDIKKSPILKFPFSIVYFPFMIYVALTLFHHIRLIAQDIMVLMKLKGRQEK